MTDETMESAMDEADVVYELVQNALIGEHMASAVYMALARLIVDCMVMSAPSETEAVELAQAHKDWIEGAVRFRYTPEAHAVAEPTLTKH